MRKNESGRSMVEMLGVLAIIGVLSIGGIAGYTLSMNRYRANTVADMANKYASLVYGSCATQVATNSTIAAMNNCVTTNLTLDNYGLSLTEGSMSIASNGIADDGVTIQAKLPTSSIASAYASIVGGTVDSSDKTIVSHKITQQ